MDSRTPLKNGMELIFNGADGEKRKFFVEDIIGYGASCIVYSGYYRNNHGRRKNVRIKECYPHKVKLVRDKSGNLAFSEKEKDASVFEKAKALFKDSFDVCNEIYESEGLTNATTNLIDIFEANSTLYTVAAYDEGETLSLDDRVSLVENIHILNNIAKIIHKIHKKGYLYLDIKPENIFVLSEMDGAVRLIDFDSLIPIDPESRMGGYRISYSRGFAALEQRQGRMNDIGRYTDVYGVGAILFYLLFGRTPEATECLPDARYEYAASRYDPYRYRDRLWVCMTEFFHHTLPSYYKDRYEDMAPAIETLSEIEEYADLTKPFICETYFPVIDEMIGRQAEKVRIGAFLQDDKEKCLLVSGMAGIGKSTIVRKCLSESEDTVVYLYFRDSIMATVCDDSGFAVSTSQRDPQETTEEYFARKLDIVKRIVGEQKAILVLDDFEGELGEEFLALLNVGWKVIVISREIPESDEWGQLFIEEMKEEEETRALFTKYLRRDIKEDEIADVDRMISDVRGHTLALELIAKQIRRSLMSVKEASELVTEKGFTLMTPKEVPHSRDGNLRTCHVMDILQGLFDREKMDGLHRGVLKALTLFSSAGVHTDILRNLLGKKLSKTLPKLSESGWIMMDEQAVSIHPIIREAVNGWSWTNVECNVSRHLMKKMSEWLISKGAGDRKSDKSEIRSAKVFAYASDVLVGAMDEKKIRQTEQYYDLFCPAVLEMPRDREDMIVRFIGLFDEAWNYSDPKWLLRVIDYGCYILYERGDFDLAARALSAASAYLKGYKNHYLTGMYYDTMSQYYDCLLGGAYETVTKDEEYIYEQMLKSNKKAIKELDNAICDGAHCVDDCQGCSCGGDDFGGCDEKKEYLANLYLTRANLIIRGYPGNRIPAREIRIAIGQAREEMKNLAKISEDLYLTYALAIAWYYTMVDSDTFKCSKWLKKIINHKNPWPSEMDQIDFCLVPCAEMMFRHGDPENAKEVLLSAVGMCEEHEGVMPYERKKQELLGFIEDVEMGA